MCLLLAFHSASTTAATSAAPLMLSTRALMLVCFILLTVTCPVPLVSTVSCVRPFDIPGHLCGSLVVFSPCYMLLPFSVCFTKISCSPPTILLSFQLGPVISDRPLLLCSSLLLWTARRPSQPLQLPLICSRARSCVSPDVPLTLRW